MLFSTIPTITIVALIISGITTYLTFIPKKSRTPAIGYLINFFFLLLFIILSLVWKFNNGKQTILWHDTLDYLVLAFAVIFLIRTIIKLRYSKKKTTNHDILWDTE